MSSYRDVILSPFDSFLPDLDRIATREYEPTDDDILRARLRTVGVQEYRVRMGSGSSCNSTYDFAIAFVLTCPS